MLGTRIRSDISHLAGLVMRLSADEDANCSQVRARAAAEYRREVEAAGKTAQEEFDSARAMIDRRSDEARDALSGVLRQGHMGALGEADSHALTHAQAESIPSLVVLGTAQSAPVLAPFIGYKGLLIAGDRRAAREYAEAVFSRIVATLPLASLRITVFDPQISGLLGGFSGLRKSMQGEAFPPAAVDTDGLRSRLEFIRAAMVETSEILRSTGSFSTAELGPEVAKRGVVDVLVMDRAGADLDERTQRVLEQLLRTGARQGVIPLVMDDVQRPEYEGLTAVHLHSSDTAVFHVEGVAIEGAPLGPVPHAVEQSLVREAADAADQDTGPVVPAERMEPHGGRGQSSAAGLEVTIGERPDGSDLVVRLRSENPPTTNALIAGAVGMGKSNLLLALIYSIAAKYAPSEVEMMLLDLKDGLEFQRFAGDREGGWLPHASVIGLDSDRLFALSVLEHAVQLKSERSTAIKKDGVNSFDAYRRRGNAMPRLLLVIDEFQVLFDGDDDIAQRAVTLLTDLVKTGRAAGIHIVLSSQTLSGMRSMATRLDAIFSQVAVRLALKNTASESQVVLSQGNRAAVDLRVRGEVILNDNAGQGEENNERGITAYAAPDFVADLQKDLWAAAGSTARPRTFAGHAFANWPTRSALKRSAPKKGLRRVLLGEAVDVHGSLVWHSFTDDTNQSLAVVGPERDVTDGILASIVQSAIERDDHEQVYVVGDLGEIAGTESAESRVKNIPAERAAEWLRSRPVELTSPSALVVFPDVQRLPKLGEAPPPDPGEMSFMTPPTAADELKLVAASAEGYRADVVFSTQSLGALDSLVGFQHDGSNGVIGYAMADVSQNDLRAVAGYGAERPAGFPRFSYTNVGSAAGMITAAPFEVSNEEGGAE